MVGVGLYLADRPIKTVAMTPTQPTLDPTEYPGAYGEVARWN